MFTRTLPLLTSISMGAFVEFAGVVAASVFQRAATSLLASNIEGETDGNLS